MTIARKKKIKNVIDKASQEIERYVRRSQQGISPRTRQDHLHKMLNEINLTLIKDRVNKKFLRADPKDINKLKEQKKELATALIKELKKWLASQETSYKKSEGQKTIKIDKDEWIKLKKESLTTIQKESEQNIKDRIDEIKKQLEKGQKTEDDLHKIMGDINLFLRDIETDLIGIANDILKNPPVAVLTKAEAKQFRKHLLQMLQSDNPLSFLKDSDSETCLRAIQLDLQKINELADQLDELEKKLARPLIIELNEWLADQEPKTIVPSLQKASKKQKYLSKNTLYRLLARVPGIFGHGHFSMTNEVISESDRSSRTNKP
jgi:uncharacterized FlaG/YvyC family protein